MKQITENDIRDMVDGWKVMGAYEKADTIGMTIWVPVEQEPLPLPQKATPKISAPFAKYTGRRLGERKRWY